MGIEAPPQTGREAGAKGSGSVEVTCVGPSTGAAFAWRMDGRIRVTVLVKATFGLVGDAPMTPIVPEPVVRVEQHHQGNPSRSVRLTSDLAPFLPATDVLLTGHACAPKGERVSAMGVRLAVFRGHALLDKSLVVRGDAQGGAFAPFDRIPLVYERAYGGIGWEQNPLGLGVRPDASGSAPNLVFPSEPAQVACFGPIARGWPQRKRLLGSLDRKLLDRPIAEIPPGFDWTYYHAAPPDQRVAYLQGDEWVLLEGLHAGVPLVRSRLPDARGAARVHGLGGSPDGQPLALVADLLRIDADALSCSVVWRGSFAIPEESVLGLLRIVVGMESLGAPLSWPALPSVTSGSARQEEPTETLHVDPVGLGVEGPAGGAGPHTGTVALGDEAILEEAPHSTLEVRDAAAPRPAPLGRTLPFAPPSEPAPGVAVRILAPENPFTGTLEIHDLEDATAHVELVPASAPPPSALRPPPVPRPAPPPAPPRKKAPRPPQGLSIQAPAALAGALIPWALTPGRDCLTVVAKATCDLTPGGPAGLRAEAEPLSRDTLTGGERGPCSYPSDFGLFKVRADVVLVGHAVPPSPTPLMQVAFRFGDDDNGFERSLLVFGDRRWVRGETAMRASPAEPFGRLPLRYDRAFGGPRFAQNPLGTGQPDRLRRLLSPLPNLEDPGKLLRTPNQTPAPACFAPVPLAWKEAWHTVPGAREARFPEDFDWTRYQVAPRAQQLGFLRGDEPFEVRGASAAEPVLAGALPGLRVRGFVAWGPDAGGGFDEVPLRLDTVVIDTDRRLLHLVWRGSLPVADERAPPAGVVHLMTESTAAAGASLAEVRARLLQD